MQLREISTFIESKFQETFSEEQKVLRATGVRDTHIHAVMFILDPARLVQNIAAGKQPVNARTGLKQRVVGPLDEELDVELLRKLQGKTTVIPIISKADTVTTAHMTVLKRSVWDSLKKLKIDPLEALDLDSDAEEEDEDDDNDDDNDSEYGSASSAILNEVPQDGDGEKTPTESNKLVPPQDPTKPPQVDEVRVSTMSENVELPYLPLSIISPDMYDPDVVGRRFPWGFADPNNAEHCDFVKLKDSVFSEWRNELRAAAHDRWYENWRTTRLRKRSQPRMGYHTVSPSNAYGSPPASQVRATSSHGASPPSASKADPLPSHNRQRTLSASQIGVAVTNGDAMASGARTSAR